jgi:hypothetical protein
MKDIINIKQEKTPEFVSELSDEILSMQSSLNCATAMMGEVTSKYFGQFNPEDGEGKNSIVQGYYKNGLRVELAFAYLFKTMKTLNKLQEMQKKGKLYE